MSGESESPIQSVLSYVEAQTIHALEEQFSIDYEFAKTYPILWWKIFNALIVAARGAASTTQDATALIETIFPGTNETRRSDELRLASTLLAYINENVQAEEFHWRMQYLSHAQLELIYIFDKINTWIREHP